MKKIRKGVKKFHLLLLLLLIIINNILVFIIIDNSTINVKLIGDETITTEIFEDYKDQGIEIKKGNKNLKKSKYKTEETNNIDINRLGTYKYIYSVKTLTKTYNVERTIFVVDTIMPTIDANTPQLVRDFCTKELKTELTYTANDNYDGDLTDKVTRKDTENQVILSVSDTSNNTTNKLIDIITEEEPKTTISLNGNKDINLYRDDVFVDPGYKVVDGCNKTIDTEVNVEGAVNTAEIGTYTITYEAIVNNKTIKAQRTINVKERPAPQHVGNKVVYLTFDDGPGIYTEELLNILDKYNVKATFFVTNQFSKYQGMIGEEARRGHKVAVHSLTHKWSIYDSQESYMYDFNKMNDIIEAQTGSRSDIFRFPGGSSNTVSKGHSKGIMTTLTQEMQNNGYQYFDWNVDSGDAAGANSTKIYNNTINGMKTHSYSVVLMHDIKKNTIATIEKIIQYGIENGYTFKTLDKSSPIVHHSVNN